MKITGIEIKQDKNGNDMKVCKLDNGKNVYINSQYEPELYPLMEIGKDVEAVQDGKFWKILPESLGITIKKDPTAPTYKKAGITEAVRVKAESIKQAQEVKGNAIVMAAASRDASLMLSVLIPTLYKNFTETELQVKWQEWRKWFYERLGDKPESFSEPF